MQKPLFIIHSPTSRMSERRISLALNILLPILFHKYRQLNLILKSLHQYFVLFVGLVA